jgi:hypothetical protein
MRRSSRPAVAAFAHHQLPPLRLSWRFIGANGIDGTPRFAAGCTNIAAPIALRALVGADIFNAALL